MVAGMESAIEWPKVTIAGQEYTLRFRTMDLIRMERSGVIGGNGQRKFGNVETLFQMLSHGLAHQVAKTAEELAEIVEPEQIADIDKACAAAMKKVTRPAAVQLREPGATG